MNPEANFITSLLNVDPSIIKSFTVHTDTETVIYEVTLKRMDLSCQYCGGRTISYGRKTKKINHPVLRNRASYILYHENRYQCKDCRKITSDSNPFTMPGFNSSTLLLQQVMKMFDNLNYTLDMISKELNISTTQLNTYLDSFITIPKRPLPECLGIDEIHNRSLAKSTSNAYTENINGKLRNYFSIARGVKNFDRFRKRVIFALNPKISYALTDKLHSDK